MCGITGVYCFDGLAEKFTNQVHEANKAIIHRGVDNQDVFVSQSVALGHVRLSIVDTSEGAHQPFSDESNRYTIIFNGEIFNYEIIREELISKGYKFRTSSDTEVVLNSFIEYGTDCFEKLNGFFAIAVFDNDKNEVVIARDRYGVKPFVYYKDKDKFIFGSEIKALIQYGIPKIIDKVSLFQYFQHNYIAPPHTIFENVKRLQAGTWMKHNSQETVSETYYKLPHFDPKNAPTNYEDAKKNLYDLLDQAVERRIVRDVPMGSFLSGGIDSSIVSTLAKNHTNSLDTFSIGYADEPMFDESKYAQLVADKIGSNHHLFMLKNDDFLDSLYDVFEAIDEPFADSSALAMNILSKHTSKHVKVALSGDGADEVFSGYNKHSAELRAREGTILNKIISAGLPLWQLLPQSRNGKTSNFFRQINHYGKGVKLSDKERYWLWSTISTEKEVLQLIKSSEIEENYLNRKSEILKPIGENGNFNDVLYTDIQLVLQGDMLPKVDLMSMYHSLEVRSPFMDYTVVDFANSLPVSFKINKKIRKRIVQDTFRDILPSELYNRPKHGFEVPLLNWFRNELKSEITDNWLSEDFIQEQGLFNYEYIHKLKKKLFSSNPGDVAAKIWAIIIFQNWWKRYFD